MSTESTIVMRARAALHMCSNIEIKIPEYILKCSFVFMNGFTCQSIEDWYDYCIKNGMTDIKISMHIDPVERAAFGIVHEKDRIVCIWNDEMATSFLCSANFRDGKEIITFTESEYDGNVRELYGVVDNTDDYKETLCGLMNLAEIIDQEYFKRCFETAYKLLDDAITPNHEMIPHYMKDLPERMKTIRLANSYSYVFGGMGSWNDSPAGIAHMKGLKKEYDNLTNALILNHRKALFYVTNEC